MGAHKGWGLSSVYKSSSEFAGLIDAKLDRKERSVSVPQSFQGATSALTALSRNSCCSLLRGRRRLVEEGYFKDSG